MCKEFYCFMPPYVIGRLSQAGGKSCCSWQLANSPWYTLLTTTATVIQESSVARLVLSNRHHESVEGRLEFSLSGQLPLSGRPHNPTTKFWPPSTTAVSFELLPHCAGSLRCLPEDMATGRLWPVCLWRATNNVSHRWFLSADKAGWWLVQAALCRWWCCCVADQLWRPIQDAHDNNKGDIHGILSCDDASGRLLASSCPLIIRPHRSTM